MTASDSNPGLLLNGLDGGNPLGYLAAIGVLRVTTNVDSHSNWQVHWEGQKGHWTPVLTGDARITADGLIDLLSPALKEMNGDRSFEFAEDLAISCEDFREVAQSAFDTTSLTDRRFADFIAAFGCESVPISAKDDRIQDTALRTMSGAGHQHFIGSMRELVKVTSSDHLRTSLFERWEYQDPKPSLRWDPIDDRRYALRWREPSGDPPRTMRGASRLAVEALPLLPTAPVATKLHTTGFTQRKREAVRFTWPIWEVPLSVETVRSLLSLSELQNLEPDRKSLIARGVVEVYRSQRITIGKYRNFTPALPV